MPSPIPLWGRMGSIHCTDKSGRLVQSSSVAQSCPTLCTPWTAECQASLSITNSQSLLKLMSVKLVTSSNHLILCRPLLLLPSIFPSIRVFSNESVLRIRWLKYWSFSFSISPSNEHSGLISFRMDWLDLLVRCCQKYSTCVVIKLHDFVRWMLSYSCFTDEEIEAKEIRQFA